MFRLSIERTSLLAKALFSCGPFFVRSLSLSGSFLLALFARPANGWSPRKPYLDLPRTTVVRVSKVKLSLLHRTTSGQTFKKGLLYLPFESSQTFSLAREGSCFATSIERNRIATRTKRSRRTRPFRSVDRRASFSNAVSRAAEGKPEKREEGTRGARCPNGQRNEKRAGNFSELSRELRGQRPRAKRKAG